jgi:hypothetical protein
MHEVPSATLIQFTENYGGDDCETPNEALAEALCEAADYLYAQRNVVNPTTLGWYFNAEQVALYLTVEPA